MNLSFKYCIASYITWMIFQTSLVDPKAHLFSNSNISGVSGVVQLVLSCCCCDQAQLSCEGPACEGVASVQWWGKTPREGYVKVIYGSTWQLSKPFIDKSAVWGFYQMCETGVCSL